MIEPKPESTTAVTVAPWPTKVWTQVSSCCLSAQMSHTFMVRSALPVKSRPPDVPTLKRGSLEYMRVVIAPWWLRAVATGASFCSRFEPPYACDACLCSRRVYMSPSLRPVGRSGGELAVSVGAVAAVGAARGVVGSALDS